MSKDFANQSILITGAAGGLGSVLAKGLAERGAELILLDKKKRQLENLYDQISASGGPEPIIMPLDLEGAGPDDYADLAAAVQDTCGGLQGLVHCAARFQGLQPLDQCQPQDWLRVMQANLNSAWALTCACLPMLKAASRANLCFLLDDPDRVGRAYWGAYGVSKYALHGLVKQFAHELDNSSVRVTGVLPQPMRTALRAQAYLAEDPSAVPDPGPSAQQIIQLLASGDQLPEPVIKLD